MKQTIPFKKEIPFKNNIKELTSISLDNDLTLKGENLVVGSFYINGTYLTDDKEEEYSYKVPVEITISDEYDTYDCEIDIDDFTYKIKNNEILSINIVVVLNNLEKKPLEDDREYEELGLNEVDSVQALDNNSTKTEERTESNSFVQAKENLKRENDTYLTYRVYMVKETDTLDSIIEKYEITKEELLDYNSFEDIKKGSKLVIPSKNDKL